MAVTCPSCGGVSRDLEFCDRCNADLVPPPVLLPPATCALDEANLTLSPEQLRHLGRPEASVLVRAGGRGWRLHWVPESLWSRWQPPVEERLTYRAPCLPPCRVVPDQGGVWVAAEATGVWPEPWAECDGLDVLGRLRRLADFLDLLGQALEGLHAAGLVWLTFDPRDIELADGQLRLTNLDLAVYPAGRCPEGLEVVPAYAAPEVGRFRDAQVGPRTDVFHLAMFAYYWLARYLAHGFFGEGLEAFGYALPPLRVYAPALPPGVAGVLARGQLIDPAGRYASVGELSTAFRAALERCERRWRSAAPVAWDVGLHTRAGAVKAALGRANEDCGLVRRYGSPERCLAVVADGISCCDVGSGAVASRTVCDLVDATFGPNAGAADFPQRIGSACRQGARALLEWALGQGEGPRLSAGGQLMGTTLTAAWLEGNTLSLANVGDSRAYLIDEGGVEQLTVDGDLGSALLAAGAPPEEVVQLGGLARALHDCVGGCYRTPAGELAIDEDRCRPRLTRWPLLPGDVVVLCTDGLVEEGAFLTPEELEDLVRRHGDLPAAALAEKLADAADARQRLPSAEEPEGFGDNITCAVIKIS
jgi:serine/threonine protein phosphatase PrpC